MPGESPPRDGTLIGGLVLQAAGDITLGVSLKRLEIADQKGVNTITSCAGLPYSRVNCVPSTFQPTEILILAGGAIPP